MNEHKLDMDKVDERLAKIYTFDGDKETQYDRWAARYDADLVGDLGYVAHLCASEIFARVVEDKNARVLDMGCGTGLVGARLRELGYTRVDGADFSAEMLTVAGERGVYNELHRHDVTAPFAADDYDALISVGLFSYGAPRIADLHHAVNCVKRGCRCVVTVNGGAWREHDLAAAVRDAADRHRFTLESVTETDYIRAENINAQVLVIRR